MIANKLDFETAMLDYGNSTGEFNDTAIDMEINKSIFINQIGDEESNCSFIAKEEIIDSTKNVSEINKIYYSPQQEVFESSTYDSEDLNCGNSISTSSIEQIPTSETSLKCTNLSRFSITNDTLDFDNTMSAFLERIPDTINNNLSNKPKIISDILLNNFDFDKIPILDENGQQLMY
ncbi:uncharacterized protein LOC116416149 [Nasonia vitripennis]|uniref:Uncharacterized protein n=1 Tax=Nasonia vitripennis TaxID=7425 RepID=A0A7M7PZR0_NASVI|nr:uncharacterized protein LOC116416149 [Nasonia vitripennis]